MKILIVDDDPTFRVLLQKILERHGLTDIECAIDGQNAIELFSERLEKGQPFRLVFLDVNMPNRDGISTIKEIRSIERSKRFLQHEITRVVMTTSTTDDAVLSNAYEALCDGYVVKPYNQSTIIDQLQALGIPMTNV